MEMKIRKIPVRTYYLEMILKSDNFNQDSVSKLNIIRAEKPTNEFYKFLFKSLGREWGWTSRLIITDEELSNILNDEKIEIYVLYIQGVPAGYFELNRKIGNEIELSYFGLFKQFIGKGYGKLFIQYVIDKALSYKPDRFWLHTCEYDHSSALKLYQKNGFTIYDERVDNEYYSEEFIKKLDPDKMRKNIHIENRRVQTSEMDFTNKISLPSIAKIFQEVAFHHANKLGFGVVHLEKDNNIWVLSKLLFRIKRYPQLDEKMEIHTWPKGLERLFALRDFEIFDEAGDVIAGGSGYFLIIDSQTRRPQRVDTLREAIEVYPDKHAIPEKASNSIDFSNPEENFSIKIRYSDLDLNDHVNNAKYIQFVLDSYDKVFLTENVVEFCEVQFLSELSFDDDITIMTEKTGELSYNHKIIRNIDKKDVCKIKLVWHKI